MSGRELSSGRFCFSVCGGHFVSDLNRDERVFYDCADGEEERVLENFCSFAVLGEDDDLGQTGMKEKKEKYVADRAIREREKSSTV